MKNLPILVLCFSLACAQKTLPAASPTTTPAPTAVAVATQVAAPPDTPLYITQSIANIQAALKKPQPIINLLSLDSNQNAALTLALADATFIKYLKTPNGKPLRNEIFGVYKARPADLPTDKQSTCNGKCYRIEMYNYALNLSSVCLVDLSQNLVFNTNHYASTQPDIPNHLKQLALQIATNAPEVAQALGYKPNQQAALMASTKTALNRSRCERSQHLCVAPTFTQNNKALWAIVDLTDQKLIGIRWTNTGNNQAVTERRLQNDSITACFCEKINEINQNGWKMKYYLTSSDGLRIDAASYQNEPVIKSASLVDWHVSYSNTEGFGYSDAVGCPTFSHAAVIAIEPPQILDLIDENNKSIGFVLQQNYWSEGYPTPCNYSYAQRYEFYNDGRFRMANASLGRGCGNNGTYRPVSRIAMAGENANFFELTPSQKWKPWATEQWQLQTPQTAYTPEGYQYKLETKPSAGYYLEPSHGQFGDGGRGDFAYLYLTKEQLKLDEGNTELLTIGPCCNTDYHQGPEKFIEPNPDNTQNTSLVIWYVPQLKNDDTPNRLYCWAESLLENGVYKTKSYPCFGGAMFVPIKK